MAISREKPKKSGFEKFFTLLTFFAACFISVSAQVVPHPPPVAVPHPQPERSPRRTARTAGIPPVAARATLNTSGIPAEKSIAVDSKTVIGFCVNSGNLKVNGWDRNEVRALVENGTNVGFKVAAKNEQNVPAAIRIINYDPAKTTAFGIQDCLRGENIEIDAPRGAILRIEGRQFEGDISAVAQVSIKNDSGDIFLRNIAQGIEAKTYMGDLRVENSGGAMNLDNTNGNIVVYNVKPNNFSEIFTADTQSGAISLQSVNFSQVSTKTSSGTISYSGLISNSGQYVFKTNTGSILLNVPPQSSFVVRAIYNYGTFNTDMPLTNVVKTPRPTQQLTGVSGSGEATLQIETYKGTILMKKSN